MYNGGYYRMDHAAAHRPYYGYPNGGGGGGRCSSVRGSFYNGAGAQPSPAGWAPRGPAAGGGGGLMSGMYTGTSPAMGRGAKPMAPPVGQIGRTGSFAMNRGGGGGGGGATVRQPSYANFGSAFGSFHSGFGAAPSLGGSVVSHPDSQLPRVSSGMNFGYSYGSFAAPEGSRPASSAGGNTSLMDMSGAAGSMRGNAAAYNYGPSGGANGGLSRNGSMYSFNSFANGLPGMGPATSFNSSASSHAAAGSGADDAEGVGGMQRQDSQSALQRQYSVAGQFYNFGAGGNVMATPFGGVRPGVMLNGRSGVLLGMGGMGPPMSRLGGPHPYPPPNQPPQQRRLGGGNSGMKSTDDVVTEGETTLLGRKNSVSNMLERKESQKRVGMYFKNKETTQEDVEYKKDGDPGTTKTASSKARDPSLVNSVKPILLFDASEEGRDGRGVENDVEIDGRTVRAVKPGSDEIQKYDMREVIFVNTREDVEVSGDSLDEIRDSFFGGCNVGMMMADADTKAGEPTEWFTWNALKAIMKNVFAKVDSVKAATANSSHYSPKFEVTLSLCVLQDDQMLDLLGDDSDFDRDVYHLENLVVAESPLFGNVPNNAVFVVVESADEFNDTLDACLERARGFFHHEEDASGHKNLDDVEEYGIILATCVLKQTRKSTSSGKFDVVVSSIFASGVGDGIIHYNRILDKNPAEPRALFFSVLHRSCHSTTIFSLKKNNPDIFVSLNTLQRFSKVELRKPKVGSVRQFLFYTESTMPKIKEDLAKMKEGRQKIQTQRFKERLELMSQDMELMLEDPEGCVPKTYI